MSVLRRRLASTPLRGARAELACLPRSVGEAVRTERGHAREGGGELVAPGPAVGEAEGASASGAGEAAGDVEEALTQPFRFREREVAFEDEQPEPGEEVLGEQRELDTRPGWARPSGR